MTRRYVTGNQFWTVCPKCNTQIRVRASDHAIWKHSPGLESVARKGGRFDPNPAPVCDGSGMIAQSFRKR